jgi:lantibiotic transport system ATP-binding protein
MLVRELSRRFWCLHRIRRSFRKSMEALIEIDGIWKSYGKTPAVCGLTLSVPAHSIYGFLGPNGAGKSTTIRMILGLQRPDRGRVSLFGKPLGPQRSTVLACMGSLVESPSLYPNLTGRENLEVHRRLLDAPKAAIDEVLETVDLISAAGQIVRGYSSGMRQRLGLAQALLGNPELLVLDEPTNGLDPAGIHQIRTLIRDLPNRRGVTIFLSSHLLAEVEQVATHVAIISAGQMRFEGSVEDLRIRSAPPIIMEVDDAARACELLTGAGIAVAFEGGGNLRVPQGGYSPADINAMLVRAGIAVSNLTLKYPTLEDAFLEMTSPRVAEQEIATVHDA